VAAAVLGLSANGVAPTGAGARRMTFKKPVTVTKNAGQAAAEPSIRAARDGTLYIVAPTGLGGVRTEEGGSGGDIIWRSANGGRTWIFLGSYDNTAGGGDADIAPDRSGDLWGSGLTLVNTTATYSSDEGENWNVNPIGQLATVVDRQWIETHKNDPFAFMNTGSIPDGRVILSRLELTPADLPAVVKTVNMSSADESYQWPGEIAVDERNSFVFVAYNTDGEKRRHDDIVVARSRLNLENRKRFVVVERTKGDSFDSFAVVDTDKAQNVYVTWTERRPAGKKGRRGKTNTYLAISRDHGKSWSDPIKINRDPATTTFPWLVGGSNNRVALAYYGTNKRGPSPEDVARKGRKPPGWRVYVAYSKHAGRGRASFKEVVATKKAVHKGNVCTSGTGCAAGTRDLLDFFQLDLDPCGKVVIAYTDNSRDTVETGGERTNNVFERIAFVKQRSGPRMYKRPLNPAAC
jgi:hypothetical protein